MADHPIPFSAPMIDAILAGRKTQTRRILNPQPKSEFIEAKIGRTELSLRPAFLFGGPTHMMLRRLARPGSRLWVRESYFQFGHWEPIAGAVTKGERQKWGFVPDRPEILFDAPAEYRKGMHNTDPATPAWHKRLGRFMPRKASRMTLTVSDVRVERLQSISEGDAIAEGAVRVPYGVPPGVPERWAFHHGQQMEPPHDAFETARDSFRHLWGSINGADSWAASPWVAAYTFTVALSNIDALAKEAA